MGIEGSGLTQEEARKRYEKNKTIAAEIENLSDEELLKRPELSGEEGAVMRVEYADVADSPEYRDLVQKIDQLRQVYPGDRFLESIALSLETLQQPFRFVDAFGTLPEDHDKRRTWERTLPKPIVDRLNKVLVGQNTMSGLVSGPLKTRHDIQKKSDFDDLYTESEAFLAQYFQGGVSAYAAMPIEEKRQVLDTVVEKLFTLTRRAIAVYEENTQAVE